MYFQFSIFGKIIIPCIVIMTKLRANTTEREPIKIELPKKINNVNNFYNPKYVDYNNQLEVASDLNGTISSTPPSGYFIETLKNRIDVYFREPTQGTYSGNLRFPEPLPPVR